MGAAEALGGLVKDERRSTFRITENITVPQPDDSPAQRFEICGPLTIARRLIVVLAAIDLNRELRRAMGKVDNISVVDRKLPREPRSVA